MDLLLDVPDFEVQDEKFRPHTHAHDPAIFPTNSPFSGSFPKLINPKEIAMHRYHARRRNIEHSYCSSGDSGTFLVSNVESRVATLRLHVTRQKKSSSSDDGAARIYCVLSAESVLSFNSCIMTSIIEFTQRL